MPITMVGAEHESQASPNSTKSAHSEDGTPEHYIYTSIRYDPLLKNSAQNTAVSFNTPSPFYMLEHHWTRLQVANWSAQFWPQRVPPKTCGTPAEFLSGLFIAVREWQVAHPKEAAWAEALRIRRRIYASGRTATEIWQIPPKPLGCLFPTTFEIPESERKNTEWTVVVDCQPTDVNEATMFKIWDRMPQSRARADAGIFSVGTHKEVLLYNTNNEILDGSNSTPYFHRNGRWVTPIGSSGGLQGTTRRWCLENRLCIESVVHKDSLQEGEVVWFSNAVRGYFWAIYHTRDLEDITISEEARRRVLLELS